MPGFADNYFAVSLSADTQGAVHLGGATYGPAPSYERILFYSSLSAGTWSAPEKVPTITGNDLFNLQIHTDSTGKPNLLFTDSSSSGDIKYSQRSGSAIWSPLTTPILSSQYAQVSPVGSATNSAMNKLFLAYVSYISGHNEVYTNTADLTMDIVPPTVALNGLLSGQITNAGSVLPISWIGNDDKSVSSVTLKYSTDGGTTFNTIASNLAASGTYQWTVPNISTSTAQIFAYAVDAGGNQGTSQSPLFAINYTPTYTLSVSKSGTGGGSISSPTGISCGSVCSSTYTTATQLTLNATADQYSTFTGWSGACSGIGACTVNVNVDKAVVATFANNSNSLTVNVTGGGTGTVTSVPTGISCSSGSCLSRYVTNNSVVLTSYPDAGSKFIGWSGDCSGTGTCQLSMSVAKNVTASFVLGQTITGLPTRCRIPAPPKAASPSAAL